MVLLAEEPQDFSLAARILFSEVMAAVNGGSLRIEHSELEMALEAVQLARARPEPRLLEVRVDRSVERDPRRR
jgi:hypothetical protein